MTRTRATVAALAVLALLTACGGSSSGTTSDTSAPAPASSSPSEAATDTPSSPTPQVSTDTGTPGPVPTTLQALQLCATALGYATAAISGAPSAQMSTFEQAVASARSKATDTEAALSAQAGVVVDAVATGDQAAIQDAGKRMGELCGSG